MRKRPTVFGGINVVTSDVLKGLCDKWNTAPLFLTHGLAICRKIQTGYKSDSSVRSAYSITKAVVIEGNLCSLRRTSAKRKGKEGQGKEGRGSPCVEEQLLFLWTEANTKFIITINSIIIIIIIVT
ncbi:hypothetical protein STEG23_015321 [Scotinomys teguina]